MRVSTAPSPDERLRMFLFLFDPDPSFYRRLEFFHEESHVISLSRFCSRDETSAVAVQDALFLWISLFPYFLWLFFLSLYITA